MVKREVPLLDIDEELFSGEVVEDPSTLVAGDHAATARQPGAAQRRFRIYRVPAGAPRLDTLGRMLALAGGGTPVEDYLAAFKRAFPKITRRDMAERFMRVMIAFGLASITDNRVMLTAEGSDYLHDDSAGRRAILARLFTERIYGAAELLAAGISNSQDAAHLQQTLEANGAVSLTATQVQYLTAWAGELGLMNHSGRSKRRA